MMYHSVGPTHDSSAPGARDLPDYFLPLPAEDLKTGALPTICSYEDMQTYKRREALQAIADGHMVTPFANGGVQMQVYFWTPAPLPPSTHLPHP